MTRTPHPRKVNQDQVAVIAQTRKEEKKQEERRGKEEKMGNNQGRSVSANGRLAPEMNNNQLFSGNE